MEIKNKLISIQRELHKPNQYGGRISELKPQLQNFIKNSQIYSDYENLDEKTIVDIIKFLENQEIGLDLIINILKKDIKDVHIIVQNKKISHLL
jgi:ATP phosphoribosyltransferase